MSQKDVLAHFNSGLLSSLLQKAKEEGATNILEDDQIETLLQNVLDEADLDGDRKLSYAEFEHVLSKAPDFVTSFRIRF